MKPLTERQRAILEWLAANGTATPTQIAYGIGMQHLPKITGGGRSTGRGRGSGGQAHRTFNPAQRIISSLTGLSNRGLIDHARRPDGWSGAAYRISEDGRREVDAS